MSHKIRLGPIAIFLTVIAAVLATLAMLTVATSRADATLAERFAIVTSLRYELETDGNRFLQQIDSSLRTDGLLELPEGAEQLDNGNVHYNVEKEGYALDVEVAVLPDGSDAGNYEVVDWKISKIWKGADPFENLWPGF
ncbi:MAG: hypothetical protein IJI10_09430 [Eubacterium sp.]|nr:hypothetical protein [Eubacterium sp.]